MPTVLEPFALTPEGRSDITNSAGWSEDDQILWQSLWGDAQTAEDGPKARVTAPSLLVVNKTDLTGT